MAVLLNKSQRDRHIFDSRAQEEFGRGQDSAHRVLLRRAGEFIRTRLEPSVAAEASLQIASRLIRSLCFFAASLELFWKDNRIPATPLHSTRFLLL